MCQNFSWRDSSLLIPDREPMADLSRVITKVQLGEFCWSYLRNMGVGLLTVAEMTLKTVVSPGPSPSIDGSPQNWEFGALFTACRQLSRWESVCSRCLSQSEPLPGSVAGFCFFRQLLWALRLCSLASFYLRGTLQLYCLLCPGGGLVNLLRSRGFLKLF